MGLVQIVGERVPLGLPSIAVVGENEFRQGLARAFSPGAGTITGDLHTSAALECWVKARKSA